MDAAGLGPLWGAHPGGLPMPRLWPLDTAGPWQSWPLREFCEHRVRLGDVIHTREAEPESLGAGLAIALAAEVGSVWH